MIMNRKRESLHLYEQVLLLALHNQRGIVASETMAPYALGGALLAELALCGRVRVGSDSPQRLVELVSHEWLGDRLLDECLERIATEKHQAAVAKWVERFAGLPRLVRRSAESLCCRGILRVEEQTVFVFFRRTVYPVADPGPARKLIDRVAEAILSESAVETSTAVLISLAHHSGLLTEVWDAKQLAARQERIQAIIAGEVTGEAIRATIEAVESCAAAVAIIPIVIACCD
jgi:hypothetical protein